MATRVQSEVLTFLIADVRDYTTFTRTRGDEAAAELAVAFAEIIREGIEAHGGDVLQLKGDGAVAFFRSARAALRAAVELQLVFEDECVLHPPLPLHVGIGVDTGEAVSVDGDYHGAPLNLAARLCSSAAAGEVLVSAGVAHAARAADDVHFAPRPPLELKGFDLPVAALNVTAATTTRGSAYEPAALTELPPELDAVTPLVGRDELVRRLRWRWRLARRGLSATVALVGTSGIGKTRAARQRLRRSSPPRRSPSTRTTSSGCATSIAASTAC